MALSEELILEELKKVIDPELFVNIVDLGLIYEVKLEDVDTSEAAESEAAASDLAHSEAAESEAAESEAAESEAAESEAAESEAPGSDVAATAEEQPEPTEPGEKKNIKIDMTLTSPMCPAGPQLIGQSKQFVGAMQGVNEVEVKIVLDPPWSPDRMTEDARDQLGIF